ncbi:MAG: phosphatase PAP2 family protein [Phyllobacteriaceae bacterium]|nr:phosphatase PAP2 family protein [Phyllobacteriaceae bacterium]
MTRPTDTVAGLIREIATTRPIFAAVCLTAFVSGVALLFPGIDVAVAGLFHHPGVYADTPFPAEDWSLLQTLRRAGMGVTRWATIVLLLALLAKVVVPLLARAFSTRKLLFLLVSLTVGPGLLINGFFKELWGRPRPVETTIFGGPWPFMPAWIPGGDCPTNCSFPSGEASGAAWLLALVFVVPERWRKPTLAAVIAWTLAISFNRMVFGSHFLSDVVIGWSLMLVVVLTARELILIRLPDATIARIDAALARLGERLTAPFRPRL